VRFPMIVRCLTIAAAAVPAVPQPAFAQERLAFNLGVGTVRSTSTAAPSASMLGTAGFDLRIPEAWQIRFEAGKRQPSESMWQTHSLYYLAPAGSPADAIAASRVLSTTEGTETSRLDVAVLLRRTRRAGRFELGGLAGLDVHFVTVRAKTWIPLSLSDPMDFSISEQVTRRSRGVLDFGVDAATHLSGPAHLLVYAIVGLQPPTEEERGKQVRAGGMVQFRF
jgi:hypothetical protein